MIIIILYSTKAIGKNKDCSNDQHLNERVDNPSSPKIHVHGH